MFCHFRNRANELKCSSGLWIREFIRISVKPKAHKNTRDQEKWENQQHSRGQPWICGLPASVSRVLGLHRYQHNRPRVLFKERSLSWSFKKKSYCQTIWKRESYLKILIKYNIQAPLLSTINQYGCHLAISIVGSEFHFLWQSEPHTSSSVGRIPSATPHLVPYIQSCRNLVISQKGHRVVWVFCLWVSRGTKPPSWEIQESPGMTLSKDITWMNGIHWEIIAPQAADTSSVLSQAVFFSSHALERLRSQCPLNYKPCPFSRYLSGRWRWRPAAAFSC